MPRSVASIALFPTHDDALAAAEKLYEVVGRRGLVRVLFPGDPETVERVAVLPDSFATFVVAAGGGAIGLLGLLVVLALGGGWLMSVLTLAWGVVAGALLAWWLTGSFDVARTLRGVDARRCYEILSGTQHAVVVVVSPAARERAVHNVFEHNDGVSLNTLNPWLTTATRTPAPVVEHTNHGR